MAGQGIERRDMLRVLALAAAAGQCPGFQRWAFACSHHGEGDVIPAPAARYTPQFFTPDEYATLDQLTALILPTDETPGAREAGVSEFIDFMVAHDDSIQYGFRFGLGWLDMQARLLHERPFRELDAAAQTSLVEPLAARVAPADALAHPGVEEGRTFFALVRKYTLMGFYTSKIGLEALGYPGLRIYTEIPDCPHPDDPEHARLAPPGR